MEPQDQQRHDQQQGSDSPRENDEQQGPDPSQGGEHATGNAGPEAPQVIGTDAPLITKGPAYQSDWTSDPDRNMIVQTSKIREPNEAFSPNFVMVPVESDRPPQGRSGAGNGEENVNEGEQEKGRKGQSGREGQGRKAQSQSKGGHDDDRGGSGDRSQGERSQRAQGPSLTRILVFSGLVALVGGVAGAWGYSYIFGSDKSGDQKSSGKSSGSSKDSGSSGDSGSSDSGSSKGSDTRKNSTSNDKDSNTGKLVEAGSAWPAAVKELRQAKDAEKAARSSEEEKKAILDFFKNTLLSAGRPGGGSLSEAFWTGGQGKDVTLHKALDLSESRVAEAFADRPHAEAVVREMLGLAYLNVGDPPRAIQQYGRALALREAMQGDNHPDAAACRNQLAVAYRLAGRPDDAARLFDLNPNSPGHAAALAVRGLMLLLEKKPAEAELKLRECMTIRRKIQPDDWTTFDTESILGEALADQKKYTEAEPLLVSGYEGLKQREAAIPPQDKPRLTRALERLVKLYEAWGKEDQAMKWRGMLTGSAATQKP